jgi:hypothetical protein
MRDQAEAVWEKHASTIGLETVKMMQLNWTRCARRNALVLILIYTARSAYASGGIDIIETDPEGRFLKRDCYRCRFSFSGPPEWSAANSPNG